MDWGRVAFAYDWQLPLERTALSAAVDLVAPGRDDVLLDVATGTGGLLRELARRHDRPRRVIGVDASSAMLQKAGALPDGWSLQTADARRLPFADRRFSIVTAAYLLHVVGTSTRRQIIGECRRVLRAGGRFVSVTPAWPRTRVARMLYAPLA
ncbi:MAG: class I SAM-dependent methyltransferase, partial [Acidimicrobiia bacterium]